jgi:hypothetical protein
MAIGLGWWGRPLPRWPPTPGPADVLMGCGVSAAIKTTAKSKSCQTNIPEPEIGRSTVRTALAILFHRRRHDRMRLGGVRSRAVFQFHLRFDILLISKSQPPDGRILLEVSGCVFKDALLGVNSWSGM